MFERKNKKACVSEFSTEPRDGHVIDTADDLTNFVDSNHSLPPQGKTKSEYSLYISPLLVVANIKTFTIY